MKTTMLGVALTMLVAAPAFTPTAFAQTTTANSRSGATSTSSSGSSASTGSSQASVTQIYNFADPPAASDPAGTSASDPSGDPTSRIQSQSNDNVHYSGGYTVRNVPEIIPPSFGGTNVCAVGASGGVGVAGFGLTLGGSWSDRGCERRSEAVVLYQMGEHNAAVALMCQDPHVAQAMQAAGRGCGPVSRPVAMVAPPPPLRPLAAAVPPAHPQVQLAAAHPAAAGACATLPPRADAADRLMYQYNCHPAGRTARP